MNPNRRWLIMFFLVAGFLAWVLASKMIGSFLGWSGLEGWDIELIGNQFTLSTLVGLIVGLGVGIGCFRNAGVSELVTEVIVELKKVTWPTPKEIKAATIVVIVTVFIMAFFLGIFDLVWSNLLDLLYPNVRSG